MGTVIEQVTRNGKLIGYVGYQTCADSWYHPIFETVEQARAAMLFKPTYKPPLWNCTAGPGCAEEHPRVWVSVGILSSESGDGLWLFQACETCRCLVTPPHDGYVYHPYPDDWQAEGQQLDGSELIVGMVQIVATRHDRATGEAKAELLALVKDLEQYLRQFGILFEHKATQEPDARA